MRGESKEHSDVDVIVIGDFPDAPHRETLIFEGWPFEIHVHTADTIWERCSRDAAASKASLPFVFVNGEVLFDRGGKGGSLRTRMQALLEAGPPALTDEEMLWFRHRITGGINDLSDPRPLGEVLFTASRLAVAMAEFAAATNGTWIAEGKALYRNLEARSPELAKNLAEAWAVVTDNPTALIELADALLEPHGGRHQGA